MENAAEALKIFLATTIFAIALAVFFRMTSLAKDTADIVFSAIDKTSLINYDAEETGENRVVTFQEIIPTIYRYAQEGYGVTIISYAGGTEPQIIARFDLDTESQVSSCFWTEERHNEAGLEAKEKSNKIKCEMEKYLNENILSKVGMPQISIGNETEYTSHGNLHSIITTIYGTESEDNNGPVYTGWLKSNTYSNNYITQRIYCDLYGGVTHFSLVNPGVDETIPDRIAGTHEAPAGTGLLARCGGVGLFFTEYIVQIDNNEYIKVTDDENNEEDTGLLEYGTLRNIKKREIIYVTQ